MSGSRIHTNKNFGCMTILHFAVFKNAVRCIDYLINVLNYPVNSITLESRASTETAFSMAITRLTTFQKGNPDPSAALLLARHPDIDLDVLADDGKGGNQKALWVVVKLTEAQKLNNELLLAMIQHPSIPIDHMVQTNLYSDLEGPTFVFIIVDFRQHSPIIDAIMKKDESTLLLQYAVKSGYCPQLSVTTLLDLMSVEDINANNTHGGLSVLQFINKQYKKHPGWLKSLSTMLECPKVTLEPDQLIVILEMVIENHFGMYLLDSLAVRPNFDINAHLKPHGKNAFLTALKHSDRSLFIKLLRFKNLNLRLLCGTIDKDGLLKSSPLMQIIKANQERR